MDKDENPDIQVISNLVVINSQGKVLLTQYNPEVDRWWLPGGDVTPFTHPDDTANAIVDTLALSVDSLEFQRVQSFRGRRGWHLAFDYLVNAEGTPANPADWFDLNNLPKTMHGDWEGSVVRDLLAV